MRTIAVMEPQPLSKSKQVRVNDRAWLALKRIVTEMSSRPRLDFEGKSATQEAVACASWLWMESLGWDALEEALAPHMARLNAIVAGEPDPMSEVADDPKVPDRRSSVALDYDPNSGEPLRRGARKGERTG